MEESRFNRVWNILGNNNFVINEEVNNDVLCGICKKIMIEPYVVSCGCRYCCRCIKDYIGEEMKHCPGGKEECSEEYLDMNRNVHIDFVARRNIINMMIKCPNDSCVFRRKLEDMNEHIRICSLKPVECPYKIIGCGDEGVREDNVENHLNLELLKHTNILIEAINHLRNDVNRLDNIVELKEREINELKKETNKNKEDIEDVKEDYRRKEILMREEIDEMKKEIRTLKDNKIRMEYQSKVMKTDEKVMKELREQMKKQREEMDILNNKEERREDVMKEREEKSEREKKETEKELQNIENTIVKMNDERRKYEEYSRKNEENIQKEINYLNLKIKQSNIEDEREYIWRYDNISKRKENKDTIRKIICKQSYKFKLYLYYYGDNLYFDCFIIKGEFDNYIKWPMKHEITLSILNQQTMEIYKYNKHKYETHNNKAAFNKPIGKYNDCICNDIIINMEDDNVKKTEGIIVNDSILLSFNIDYQ